MSTIDHDGFTIDSSNPDADAVTANLDATTPAPVGDAAAPESLRGPSDGAEGRPTDEAAETTETPERERHPDGKYAKKGSIQERIDKAVAAQRAAERERDALKAQWDAQRSHVAPERPQEAPEPSQPQAQPFDPAQGPQLDQFESYEQWVDARSEWKAEVTWQRIQAAQQQQQALVTHTERIHSFATQQQPDYFEKIQAAARLPVSKVMEAAIISSDRGPELAYFLATHPEEAIRLAQEHVTRPLSDAPFVRELLESKLTSQAASSGPASGVSRQPVYRPIKPVGATPVHAETSPEDLPFGTEYVEKMNARDRARGRRY